MANMRGLSSEEKADASVGTTNSIQKSLIDSRTLFVAEVLRFKKKHSKKLKELLDPIEFDKIENNPQISEFLSNSVISAYLSRDASDVTFVDNHPHLVDTTVKAEKTKTDYYELKIYNHLKYLLLFRGDVTSSQFYANGISHNKRFCFKELEKQFNTDTLYVAQPRRIEHIRDLLNRYSHERCDQNDTSFPEELKNKKFNYMLTPNWYGDHATLLFHILNPNTKRVLVSIFIDSKLDQTYLDHMENIFNHTQQKNNYYWLLDDNLTNFVSTLKNQFFIDPADDKGIFIDLTTRTAYAISADPASLYSDTRVDEIFYIDRSNDSRFIPSRKIPFIDASHSLQTSGDLNCAVYGFNFSKAIAAMLQDTMISDEIYQLAESVDKGNDDAKNQLSHIFKEKLKSYLPCYYDQNNQAKSHADIKEYHMKQRWNMDSELLAMPRLAAKP